MGSSIFCLSEVDSSSVGRSRSGVAALERQNSSSISHLRLVAISTSGKAINALYKC